jgi:hypothetical protein
VPGRPAVMGEPALDRPGEPLGVEVDVDVDAGERRQGEPGFRH